MGEGEGVCTYIHTYIQITNLFLLLLDVDLLFLDNKNCMLNSMGLCSGRRAYECVFGGFTVCCIK